LPCGDASEAFKITVCDLERSNAWNYSDWPEGRDRVLCPQDSQRGVSVVNAELIPYERLEKAILIIRGHRVMLDTELAALYESRASCADPSCEAQHCSVSTGLHVPAHA
jgi:hypothetical protein